MIVSIVLRKSISFGFANLKQFYCIYVGKYYYILLYDFTRIIYVLLVHIVILFLLSSFFLLQFFTLFIFDFECLFIII